jgi:putative FmdB family regulatory protein
MPLYNYLCADCGHAYTDLVFGDQLPRCPECDGERAEKQLSTFAVHGERSEPPALPGPCGSCGDPRGPGACGFDA